MTTVVYTPKEFATIIKVSTRTLSRWDEEGLFVARRTPTGGKFYTECDLEKYIGQKVITEEEALKVLLDFSIEDIDNGRTITMGQLREKLRVRKEGL